jgi:hypothetical protein
LKTRSHLPLSPRWLGSVAGLLLLMLLPLLNARMSVAQAGHTHSWSVETQMSTPGIYVMDAAPYYPNAIIDLGVYAYDEDTCQNSYPVQCAFAGSGNRASDKTRILQWNDGGAGGTFGYQDGSGFYSVHPVTQAGEVRAYRLPGTVQQVTLSVLAEDTGEATLPNSTQTVSTIRDTRPAVGTQTLTMTAPPTYPYHWFPDAPMTGGGISAPLNNSLVKPNKAGVPPTSIVCTAIAPTDNDLRVQYGTNTPVAETNFTYQWTCPAGTFANPNLQSTSWTAPAQVGEYVLTVTVNDASSIGPNDQGSRDDLEVFKRTVKVLVYSGSWEPFPAITTINNQSLIETPTEGRLVETNEVLVCQARVNAILDEDTRYDPLPTPGSAKETDSPFTYSWSRSSGTFVAGDSGSPQVSWKAPSSEGPVNIFLQVDDPGNAHLPTDAYGSRDDAPFSQYVTVHPKAPTWKADDDSTLHKIHGGDVTKPLNNSLLQPGQTFDLIATAASDTDIRTSNAYGTTRIEGDTFTYQWTATGGTFENNISQGLNVRWQAPTLTGTYEITFVANDQAVMAPGDKGSRDDGAKTTPITVQVYNSSSEPGYDPSDKIQCAGITPAGPVTMTTKTTQEFRVATATDYDLRYDPLPNNNNNMPTREEDKPCTYRWTADDGGAFVGGDSGGQMVVWEAPNVPGDYFIKVKVDDPGVLPDGATGSRDDQPLEFKVLVHVVHPHAWQVGEPITPATWELGQTPVEVNQVVELRLLDIGKDVDHCATPGCSYPGGNAQFTTRRQQWEGTGQYGYLENGVFVASSDWARDVDKISHWQAPATPGEVTLGLVTNDVVGMGFDDNEARASKTVTVWPEPKWEVDTPVQPTIMQPTADLAVDAGTEVPCSGLGTDGDVLIRGGITSHPQDTCSYSWSATGGTFKDNVTTGPDVVWIAPEEPGSYHLTLSVDDANDANRDPMGTGSRNDTPRSFQVALNVIEYWWAVKTPISCNGIATPANKTHYRTGANPFPITLTAAPASDVDHQWGKVGGVNVPFSGKDVSDTITYAWSVTYLGANQSGLPAAVGGFIGGSTTASVRWAPPKDANGRDRAGTYTFHLRVDDTPTPIPPRQKGATNDPPLDFYVTVYVCSGGHPINYTPIQRPAVQAKLVVEYQWGSDTGNVADLANCRVGEFVTYDGYVPGQRKFYMPPAPFKLGLPGLANPTIKPDPYWAMNKRVVPKSNNTLAFLPDVHSAPGLDFQRLTVGSFTAYQRYRYRCDLCMPKDTYETLIDGIQITRSIERPGATQTPTGFQYRITKTHPGGPTMTHTVPL